MLRVRCRCAGWTPRDRGRTIDVREVDAGNGESLETPRQRGVATLLFESCRWCSDEKSRASSVEEQSVVAPREAQGRKVPGEVNPGGPDSTSSLRQEDDKRSREARCAQSTRPPETVRRGSEGDNRQAKRWYQGKLSKHHRCMARTSRCSQRPGPNGTSSNRRRTEPPENLKAP
jgi:hypothetical protein